MLALALAAPARADAAPLLFQCDIWAGSNREHIRHMIALDFAECTVADGSTRWRDGVWDARFKHLVNLRAVLGRHPDLGQPRNQDAEAVVTLMLDLGIGRYRFVSPGQQLSDGTCHRLPDAI